MAVAEDYWFRDANTCDEQRKAAIRYFTQRDYAQQHYPEESRSIRDNIIFRGLEAKPTNGSS